MHTRHLSRPALTEAAACRAPLEMNLRSWRRRQFHQPPLDLVGVPDPNMERRVPFITAQTQGWCKWGRTPDRCRRTCCCRSCRCRCCRSCRRPCCRSCRRHDREARTVQGSARGSRDRRATLWRRAGWVEISAEGYGYIFPFCTYIFVVSNPRSLPSFRRVHSRRLRISYFSFSIFSSIHPLRPAFSLEASPPPRSFPFALDANICGPAAPATARRHKPLARLRCAVPRMHSPHTSTPSKSARQKPMSDHICATAA